MIAAFGFAAAVLATKKLSSTEAPLTIVFYMTLIQLPMGLIPALDGFVMPTGITWFWLGLVSFCGLSAHYCMARAFRWGDATLVVPMDFLRLPLIIGGVYGNVLYESRGIAKARKGAG